MSELAQHMDSLRTSGTGALIIFMMAGFPDFRTSADCLLAVEEGGCDVIELGVPFSDPLADGEIIEHVHHQAVSAGVSLGRVLDFIDQVGSRLSVPLVLFSYFNPIYRRGVDRTMEELEDLGVKGIIVPDLPLEELGRLRGYGVDVIPMVAPSTKEERLALAGEERPSFVYCVSSPGVTGSRNLPPSDIKSYLCKVKERVDRPLALGFGISSAEDILCFRGYADGFVVGSHLARLMLSSDDTSLLPSRLKKEVEQLKAATRVLEEVRLR